MSETTVKPAIPHTPEPKVREAESGSRFSDKCMGHPKKTILKIRFSEYFEYSRTFNWRTLISILIVAALVAAFFYPEKAQETVWFVLEGLLDVAPLVIPGILLSAWVTASGAGARIADVFNGSVVRTVFVASFIGAITPVCGITVLPLMTGLLASGVPLAPIMAFWLSSPVTDPAMLATTAATLGISFALGKTLAAFAIGLLGGFAIAILSHREWVQSPLRNNSLVRNIGGSTCGQSLGFQKNPLADGERRHLFINEFIATGRLVLICLIPAFAAEFLLNEALHPQALTAYVGSDSWWAIPLAVFVGAPAYLDGFAALPLTRGLIDHGMSQGAAMAFLVSGAVVSIWGAMAIFPVLRLKPFLSYLIIAVVGSLISGFAFELFS